MAVAAGYSVLEEEAPGVSAVVAVAAGYSVLEEAPGLSAVVESAACLNY